MLVLGISIEEPFGWMKTVGGLRKTRHCGRQLVQWFFVLTATAYNLFASRRFCPQRDESVRSAEYEATIYRIPNMHRGSPPISPFAAIANIEKFDLTTSFFSSLLAD
jgi:hypothetical protein